MLTSEMRSTLATVMSISTITGLLSETHTNAFIALLMRSPFSDYLLRFTKVIEIRRDRLITGKEMTKRRECSRMRAVVWKESRIFTEILFSH